MAADARQKKESLLEVQAQVKDAEALALATRQEAEKIQKRAEDAQVQAATAASMQPNATNDNPDPRQPVAPIHGSQQGAYGPTDPQFFTGHSGPSYNPVNQPTGYGVGQHQSGFNANVMASGGGFAIPTPQNDDVYSNPFSS